MLGISQSNTKSQNLSFILPQVVGRNLRFNGDRSDYIIQHDASFVAHSIVVSQFPQLRLPVCNVLMLKTRWITALCSTAMAASRPRFAAESPRPRRSLADLGEMHPLKEITMLEKEGVVPDVASTAATILGRSA